MRMHEMAHGFIQAHLVPDQPRVNVKWDEISEEDSIALTKEHRDSDSYANKLHEAARQTLFEDDVRMYQDQPLTALANLHANINEARTGNASWELSRIARGLAPQVPFEAKMAGVMQRISASLRDNVYAPYRATSVKDFEEGLATYFAYKAHPDTPVPATWAFHQGEQAKKYTLALAATYPDPKHAAGIITQEGMQEFLGKNKQILAN